MLVSDPRTGPDMVRLLKNSKSDLKGSRTATAVLLFLFSMVFCAMPEWLEAKDETIEQSGILYPEGFDPNTVGEVQGNAHDVFFPTSGPVRFHLTSNKETYTVFVSPRWYWQDLGIKITDGEKVSVIGSKSLGKDGNLYIIAQEIRIPAQNKSFIVRNNNTGRPLWKGSGQGPGGARRGYGSSSGGFGGMGRGLR
jgi:hypothetical protein